MEQTKNVVNLEISSKNYQKAANTLALMVEQISSIKVPEQTILDWKILFLSMRIVDNKLDHIVSLDDRLDIEKKIANFLNGEIVNFDQDEDFKKAMIDVKNLALKLSEEDRVLFVNSILRILKVTEKIKIEENIKNLVDLTRLEGQITSRVFIPFLSAEFKSSKDYPILLKSLTRLGRAANSFDTFIDLPSDYRNKQVAVFPSLKNRIFFLGAVFADGFTTLKNTKISPDLIKEFFLRAKDTNSNFSERQ